MKKVIIVLFSSLALTACGQAQKSDQTKTQNLEKMQNESILKPVKTLIEAMQAENAELIRAQFQKLQLKLMALKEQ